MPLLTYTDRVIPLPADVAAPSLMDIAVATSRQPRFGGHTSRWWSVLDHLLFCDTLVQWTAYRRVGMDKPGQLRLLRLAVLLHDAHEAVTADVPTDAKGPGLRLLQKDLDRAIMDTYFPGGLDGYDSWKSAVKEVDALALVAEANVIGPPVSEKRLAEVEPRFAVTMSRQREALNNLRHLLGQQGYQYVGVPPTVNRQEAHPGVVEYLSRVMQVM